MTPTRNQASMEAPSQLFYTEEVPYPADRHRRLPRDAPDANSNSTLPTTTSIDNTLRFATDSASYNGTVQSAGPGSQVTTQNGNGGSGMDTVVVGVIVGAAVAVVTVTIFLAGMFIQKGRRKRNSDANERDVELHPSSGSRSLPPSSTHSSNPNLLNVPSGNGSSAASSVSGSSGSSRPSTASDRPLVAATIVPRRTVTANTTRTPNTSPQTNSPASPPLNMSNALRSFARSLGSNRSALESIRIDPFAIVDVRGPPMPRTFSRGSTKGSPSVASVKTTGSSLQRGKLREIWVVDNEYEVEYDGDLRLVPGHLVLVQHRYGDGWLWGTDLTVGGTGVFPEDALGRHLNAPSQNDTQT
ncbi:hypothetical protein M427DRAFT_56045 [Gonapodya prolifera JEL478]|uniref:SH3 domain-containing protein n=1 Tax=Gonapodya prolifera (strain JEL478) TaxID=1344416 RepID=A0A139AIB2_GONPJ|nr:hypothetical protein M427DRAFT_56045 [Gonapodya prolifera JEL478]|eukprot:KXS16155.1 hypothetical protein M427DRAFT_56045 [Gonapodya prolifera JEL478]